MVYLFRKHFVFAFSLVLQTHKSEQEMYLKPLLWQEVVFFGPSSFGADLILHGPSCVWTQRPLQASLLLQSVVYMQPLERKRALEGVYADLSTRRGRILTLHRHFSTFALRPDASADSASGSSNFSAPSPGWRWTRAAGRLSCSPRSLWEKDTPVLSCAEKYYIKS